MIRQTGGWACGATSIRSRPFSWSMFRASRTFMMPTGFPSSSMTRTSRTRVSRGPRRICSLTRKSLLIAHPSGDTSRSATGSRSDSSASFSLRSRRRQTGSSVPEKGRAVNLFLHPLTAYSENHYNALSSLSCAARRQLPGNGDRDHSTDSLRFPNGCSPAAAGVQTHARLAGPPSAPRSLPAARAADGPPSRDGLRLDDVRRAAARAGGGPAAAWGGRRVSVSPLLSDYGGGRLREHAGRPERAALEGGAPLLARAGRPDRDSPGETFPAGRVPRGSGALCARWRAGRSRLGAGGDPSLRA